MKIIEKAIKIAAIAHDGQYRKKTTLPYLSHPVTVGFYLLESGASEEVVASGILHDVLEDTSLTFAMLKEEFGEVIANLVSECSEPDKSLEWEERKLHTIQRLKTASFSVKQITCADKLHNLRTIQSDSKSEGSLVWERFTRGRDQQQWYYDAIFTSLMTNLSPEQASYPLFGELHKTIVAVFHQ